MFDDFSKYQTEVEGITRTDAANRMVEHNGKMMKYDTYLLATKPAPIANSVREILSELIENQQSLVAEDKAAALSMQKPYQVIHNITCINWYWNSGGCSFFHNPEH